MVVRKQVGGFSLVECMVATVILGIGVVGVAGMFTYASISDRKATYMARAREICSQTLEEVRSAGDSALTGASGSRTVETPGLPRSNGIMAWEPYPFGSPENGLKLVALNITWDWPKPSSGVYRVVTLVSDEGSL